MKQNGQFLQSVTVIRWTSGTTYQVKSLLPPVSVPGKEVTVKYYRWLQISQGKQTWKFAH